MLLSRLRVARLLMLNKNKTPGQEQRDGRKGEREGGGKVTLWSVTEEFPPNSRALGKEMKDVQRWKQVCMF
jgi:hypothetical protein